MSGYALRGIGDVNLAGRWRPPPHAHYIIAWLAYYLLHTPKFAQLCLRRPIIEAHIRHHYQNSYVRSALSRLGLARFGILYIDRAIADFAYHLVLLHSQPWRQISRNQLQ
jgi:hypothetical protein